MRNFFLYSLLLLVLPLLVKAQDDNNERTIFDKDGEPRAYITDDKTIYLWTGEAVAYLTSAQQSNFQNVYGFNGKHLGWFCEGIIFDRNKKLSGFTKAAIGVSVQPSLIILEKDDKRMKPMKRMREREPFGVVSKPFGIYRWIPLVSFLRKGEI